MSKARKILNFLYEEADAKLELIKQIAKEMTDKFEGYKKNGKRWDDVFDGYYNKVRKDYTIRTTYYCGEDIRGFHGYIDVNVYFPSKDEYFILIDGEPNHKLKNLIEPEFIDGTKGGKLLKEMSGKFHP